NAGGLPTARLPLISSTGAYTITIVPSSNGTGSVSLRLWSDINAGSVAVGETKAITINSAGQQAKFTFTAAANDQLGFALTGVTLPSGGTISILNPSGVNFYSNSFNAGGLPTVRLPLISVGGTYTVTIVPSSNGTGNFSFTLWKDVNGGA